MHVFGIGQYRTCISTISTFAMLPPDEHNQVTATYAV